MRKPKAARVVYDRGDFVFYLEVTPVGSDDRIPVMLQEVVELVVKKRVDSATGLHEIMRVDLTGHELTTLMAKMFAILANLQAR